MLLRDRLGALLCDPFDAVDTYSAVPRKASPSGTVSGNPVRGRGGVSGWVEIDRERLKATLDQFRAVERLARKEGLSKRRISRRSC
jgi:hypothetical protein